MNGTLFRWLYRKCRRSFEITTGPLRVLPDFLILGVMRGGTTSLYTYLVEHPSIVSASDKEVHYFDYQFDRGANWYRSHFPTMFSRYYFTQIKRIPFVTGEATPYYVFHPLAIKRIHGLIPGAKLIVLLRNPVDRAFSHYCMERDVVLNNEPCGFSEALEKEESRLKGEGEKILADGNYYSHNHRHYSYLARGLYLGQIQNILTYFPKDRLLIECSEEFYAAPHRTVQRILEFLNLPDSKQETFEKLHGSSYDKQEPMGAALRNRLIEYYRPHNRQLFEFLGRRFDWDR